MNFRVHLPRFLEICKYLCFVCIVVGEEECMISSLRSISSVTNSAFAMEYWSRAWSTRDSKVCAPPSYSVFLCVTTLSLCDTLFRVCHLLLWWNITYFVSREGIIISAECLRIARISLNYLSAFLQISNLVWNLLRWRQCNQSSYMNSFPIFFSILEVWLLPRIFLSTECVYNLPLGFIMVSNHTYLKMRVSTECLLHVCHPEIVVPNSVLSMDSFLL